MAKSRQIVQTKENTHQAYGDSSPRAEAVIRRMLDAANLRTQTELADLLGVGKAAITDAKRRDQIPADWLLKLCRERHVNPIWLESGLGSARLAPGGSLDAAGPVFLADPASDYNASPENFALVPMVKARVSAGGGSLETRDEIQAYYAFRKEWLVRKGQVTRMRLMRVTGVSMEPTLRDEDMVLLDLSQRDILAGKIYAVRIDDEIVVKRLDKRPGAIVLISDNHACYPPLEVPLDDAHCVELIGRVIWMAREVM